MCEQCLPNECDWCLKPIDPTKPFARVMTKLYTKQGETLKEHWQDYHWNSEIHANPPHDCLWHSTQ